MFSYRKIKKRISSMKITTRLSQNFNRQAILILSVFICLPINAMREYRNYFAQHNNNQSPEMSRQSSFNFLPDESFSPHSYKRNSINSRPGHYENPKSSLKSNNSSMKNSPITSDISTKLPTITTNTQSNSTKTTKESQNLDFDIDYDPLMAKIDLWLNEDNNAHELPQIKLRNKKQPKRNIKIERDPFIDRTAQWLQENDGASFIDLAEFDPNSDFSEYTAQFIESSNNQPQPTQPVAEKTSNTYSPRSRLSFVRWQKNLSN